VQQLAGRVERSHAQIPSVSQPLADYYCHPGEERYVERVEPYGPPRPNKPVVALTPTPEIAP